MTPQDKRERREARHELQAETKQILSRGFRLNHTQAQVKAVARILADRVIGEVMENAGK